MSYLLAILVYAASLVSCVGYGALWLRGLRRSPHSGSRDALPFIQAAALGMGTLAYLVLAAGLLGWLQPAVLGVLVAAGWVPALPLLLTLRKKRTEAPEAPEGSFQDPGSLLPLLLSVFVLLLAVTSLLSALRPMDSWDWDSLSYHLAAPKIYLREGRIGFIAYDNHTNFPFTLEMLYTVGLAFGGVPAAKLFHWGAHWLTVAAIGVWTSRLRLKGEQVPGWTGPLAAALYGGIPVAMWEAGTAYIDLGTALFQFLALAALIDAVDCKLESAKCKVQIGWRGAVLAGVFTGFALGTKYTALLQFGLLGLGLLFLLARAEGPARRGALVATLGFGIAALGVASPWYVKNVLWVGNPVYPFFYSLFPHSFSWSAELAKGYANEQSGFGQERTPSTFLLVFWDLAMKGREFWVNGKNAAGDILATVGPAWAGTLPLVLWVRGLGWRVWALLAYGLASVVAWYFLTQQVRYLIPVFAPLAVVAAMVVAASPRVLRVAGGVFCTGVLLLNLATQAPQALVSLAVVSGQVTEQEFLQANLGDLYAASRWANENLPPESRIALYEETRGYYLDRPYFWANPGHHNLIPYERLANGKELVDTLRRFGITHVWLTADFLRGKETAPWYKLLIGAIQTEQLERIHASERARDGRGGVLIFRVPPAAGEER